MDIPKPGPCPQCLIDWAVKAPAGGGPKGKPSFFSAPAQQLKRARSIAKWHGPAISGQGGHNHTFQLACMLIHGLKLADDQATQVLQEWNSTCQPPWSQKELQHKIKQAREKGSYNDLGPPMSTNGNGKLHKQPGQQPAEPIVKSSTFAKLKPRNVEWLWRHMIPIGKITILDGDPDLGKSTLLFDLAARVSGDGIMPDGSQGINGHVLILSAEDDAEDTIINRLIAANANLERCHTITAIGTEPPRIPAHIEHIKKHLQQHHCRLLILDPLTAYLDADFVSDQKVRTALHPFAQILHECRCACTALRHLNKGNGTKALYRGGGSIAIIAAARAGFVVAQDPDNPKARVFAQTKHNLGPQMPSLRYTLEWIDSQHACRVAWVPGTCSLTADDLLKPPDDDAKKSQTQEAIDFLQDYLASGPKKAKEIHDDAAKHKISSTQAIKDAKAKLGIISKPIKDPQGKLDGWEWSIPQQPDPGDPLE